MKPVHINPEEAVKIHQDVKSQRSIGIHWGTFAMTDEVFNH
jgi:N-acyl-phosphatidylethanolamine-hydrolysing phospholipase D